jgi:hypothetical protein
MANVYVLLAHCVDKQWNPQLIVPKQKLALTPRVKCWRCRHKISLDSSLQILPDDNIISHIVTRIFKIIFTTVGYEGVKTKSIKPFC